MLVLTVAIALVTLSAVKTEMIDECTCSQVESCRSEARRLLVVCATECEVSEQLL